MFKSFQFFLLPVTNITTKAGFTLTNIVSSIIFLYLLFSFLGCLKHTVAIDYY